ncbi:hypothetical protein K1Y78_36630 [Streptomyces sp. tea 10]|nr:hypothetical protein [Streptomyces sp. tea 10]
MADPSRPGGSAGTWLSLAFLAEVVWAVFLFLLAPVSVARTGFGAAAVHPAAAPVLATFLVWTFAATAKLPSGPMERLKPRPRGTPPLSYDMCVQAAGPRAAARTASWVCGANDVADGFPPGPGEVSG